MNKKILIDKIHDARTQLGSAEESLDLAMREIQSAPRADKTHQGEGLERAFSALRAARERLAELETVLATDEPIEP